MDKFTSISLTIAVMFAFFTLYLGEVHDYYNVYWWWDLGMHAKSGACIASFLTLLLLKHYQIKALHLAVMAFCFTSTTLILWEVFEYLMDTYGKFNMQKDGIKDTMEDIMIGQGFAFVGTVTTYIYQRNK